MEEIKYRELEDRALLLAAEKKDMVRKLEARATIIAEIEAMRQEGKALTLTEEEVSMLQAFRRFKLRMRRWEMRRAFYAGAQAIMFKVITSLAPDSEPTTEDLAMMENLQQELNDFSQAVKDGRV